MNLGELRALLWWTCDNGMNMEDLRFLQDDNDVRIINTALHDLAGCLRIIQHNSMLTPSVTGSVTLPPDLLMIERVLWNKTNLKPINNVQNIPVDTAAHSVTHYMQTARDTIQLYATPVAPFSVLDLWYLAYPSDLINDADVPEHVPLEYHPTLVEVYGRAKFLEKISTPESLRQAQHLYAVWSSVIKKEVCGIVNARQKPVIHTGRWCW